MQRGCMGTETDKRNSQTSKTPKCIRRFMRKTCGTMLYLNKQSLFVHAQASHDASEHDMLML